MHSAHSTGSRCSKSVHWIPLGSLQATGTCYPAQLLWSTAVQVAATHLSQWLLKFCLPFHLM